MTHMSLLTAALTDRGILKIFARPIIIIFIIIAITKIFSMILVIRIFTYTRTYDSSYRYSNYYLHDGIIFR